MIILLKFVFEISDYAFSRRGNTNFPFGTLVNLYAPLLPSGERGVVIGTDINILYFLPVKCIKHNVICPPRYFWM